MAHDPSARSAGTSHRCDGEEDEKQWTSPPRRTERPYARVIDTEQFEEWPKLFHDPCLYKLTTAENVASGLEGGLIYADTRGMLEDRVSSLRKVNIYERQRYRHIVGLPVVLGQQNGAAEVETPFLIVRIMREGDMDVFATGCYRDKVKRMRPAPALAERIVICDGRRFDTLSRFRSNLCGSAPLRGAS